MRSWSALGPAAEIHTLGGLAVVRSRMRLARVHYRGNVSFMALAKSKVTAQGQISVPAEIRRVLGVGPGTVLEWNEENGKITVTRVRQHSSEEIHAALFPSGTKRRGTEELKEGIKKNVRARYARR
ncbi:MAG: AbrB/MazE/SpoVT family DNA-binding domain-containing protein [Deltaproteobacteria bacterium]|nr:AbrB/MazE/SpoVT family DNA-binding domain-containing protein [Deltaproteobacteria bacterium]